LVHSLRCNRPGAGPRDFLADDPSEVLLAEKMVGDQTGVEGEGAEEAAELSDVGLLVRIGHGRPSSSVESGEILPIGGEEGLSCTSPADAKHYDRVSAIRVRGIDHLMGSGSTITRGASVE
jgi:hypothetical protein